MTTKELIKMKNLIYWHKVKLSQEIMEYNNHSCN